MAQEYWLKFNENDAGQGPYSTANPSPGPPIPHQVDLTHKGVFLFLNVIGGIAGAILFLSGVVGVYSLFYDSDLPYFQNTTSYSSSNAYDMSQPPTPKPVKIFLAIYLLPGIAFFAALVNRRAQGRWLLLFGAITTIILSLYNFVMKLGAIYAPLNPRGAPSGAMVSHIDPTFIVRIFLCLILSLTFPILCIVAFICWRRARSTPALPAAN